MAVPLIQRHESRFSERNTYADAVLGLFAASRELEAFAARQAAAAAPKAEPGGLPERAEPTPPEEVVLFLLGLVSAGRRLRSVVAGWTAAAPHEHAQRPEPIADSVRGWLR